MNSGPESLLRAREPAPGILARPAGSLPIQSNAGETWHGCSLVRPRLEAFTLGRRETSKLRLFRARVER